MKLSKTLILWLGLGCSFAGAGDMECNELDTHLYMGVGGGYIQSGTGGQFKGGGASAFLGYNFIDNHNVEVQAMCLFEHASASTTQSGNVVQYIPNSTPQVAPGYIDMQGKVHLNQFPIMINYCYRSFFDAESKFGFCVGMGVGVNIAHYDKKIAAQKYVSGVPIPDGSNSYQGSKTLAEPAGQLFLGLNYEITEKLGLQVGGTALFTKKFSFGGKVLSQPNAPASATTFYTPQLDAQVVHWMINAGLTYHF